MFASRVKKNKKTLTFCHVSRRSFPKPVQVVLWSKLNFLCRQKFILKSRSANSKTPPRAKPTATEGDRESRSLRIGDDDQEP